MTAKILGTIVVCLAFVWFVALWLTCKEKRWEIVVLILSGILVGVIVLLGVVAIWE